MRTETSGEFAEVNNSPQPTEPGNPAGHEEEQVVTSSDGLRGRALVAWALGRGESVVDELNPTQQSYFEAVARRAGVQWPKGFFEADISRLMDRK